jgi:hypothetical protein
MSETQMLLDRITTLRKRLQQAHGLSQEVSSSAAEVARESHLSLASLVDQVQQGEQHDAMVEEIIQAIPQALGSGVKGNHPTTQLPLLSSRARRVAERGRALLARLRSLDEKIAMLPGQEEDDTCRELHYETTRMIDSTLRTIPLLPSSTTFQLSLCAGLEATLDLVGERLELLQGMVDKQHREEKTLAWLADLFTEWGDFCQQLDSEKGPLPRSPEPLWTLAEEILEEARCGAPLHIPAGNPASPARFAAAQGLGTARVMARILDQQRETRLQHQEAILAALVHDIGMTGVPSDLLMSAEPLAEEQRSCVERHCHDGAAIIGKMFPDRPHLTEAAACHHERPDGTGYPDGLRFSEVSPLVCLLAVCDTYTAMRQDRPHRQARGPRTALTDTLLLAEENQLERQAAERLLALTFYPVGSIVELSSGAIGVVVGLPRGDGGPGREFNRLARPVILLLTDSQGHPLPGPNPLDLAQCESQSIVRSLSSKQGAGLWIVDCGLRIAD